MKQRPPLAERIKKGLQELIAHEKGEVTLRTREVFIPDPPQSYTAEDIARIRKGLGYSQTVFARVLAVSPQTVRGWEQGSRRPSGSAARLLQLLEHPDHLQQLATLADPSGLPRPRRGIQATR